MPVGTSALAIALVLFILLLFVFILTWIRRSFVPAGLLPVRRPAMLVMRAVCRTALFPIIMAVSPIMFPVIVFMPGTYRRRTIMRIMRVLIPPAIVVDTLRMLAHETYIHRKLGRRKQALDFAIALHPQGVNLRRRFIPIPAIAPGLPLDALAVGMDNFMILGCFAGRKPQGLFHPSAALAMRFIPAETNPKLAVARKAANHHQQTDQTDSFHVSQRFLNKYSCLSDPGETGRFNSAAFYSSADRAHSPPKPG